MIFFSSKLANWTPGTLSFDEKEFVKKALKLSQEFLSPKERERMVLQLPILQAILKTALVDEEGISDLLKITVPSLRSSDNPVKDLITKARAYHPRKAEQLIFSIISKRLQHPLSKDEVDYIRKIIPLSAIRESLLQKMLEFTLLNKDNSTLDVSRLSSSILPFIQLAASHMSEENHKVLSYILAFMGLDDRIEQTTYIRIIHFMMDWDASDWKNAIFSAQSFPLTIAKIFSHKDILGKRGKWNRRKLSLFIKVVKGVDDYYRSDLSRLIAGQYYRDISSDLLHILEGFLAEKAVKRAYQVLEFYYKKSDDLWRPLVIQHAKEENFKSKVMEEYLFQVLGIPRSEIKKVLSSLDSDLMEDVLDWIDVFDGFPNYLPVFQHFFSLSPDEYKKERYKGFNVPSELKEAWLKDYRQQVTYLPGSHSYSGEQLLQAIQDFNNHLKEKEWEGPWLEPSLLEEDPFTNLRKFEEEIIQKAPSSLRDMIAYDLRRIRSLLSTGEIPPNLTFLITDSLELLFRMGKGPRINSCQAPDYPGYYKIGLLGAIANPWVKMATLIDEKGQIIGRAKLYLLKKDDGYYVMVDKYYGYDETKKLLVKHLTDVLEEWKAQGLIKGYYLFERGEGEPAGPFRAPIYTDLGINGRWGVIEPD